MLNIERVGSIKLIDSGELLFEGGRQTKSGFPPFEGVVSLSGSQQVDMAVILKRKGEREFLRIGGIDFAFYFKESGRCNFVVKDLSAGKVSVFPLNPLEQEELRRMLLYSLYRQTVSLFLEGVIVFKEHDSTGVEINGVFLPEEECFKLSQALNIGSYYECRIGGNCHVAATIAGYSVDRFNLSTESSYKLQVVFESAALFSKPTFLFIDRVERSGL